MELEKQRSNIATLELRIAGLTQDNEQLLKTVEGLEAKVKESEAEKFEITDLYAKLKETSSFVNVTGKETNSFVNVTGKDHFIWNTSLTREDSGKGACELFYVEELLVSDEPLPAEYLKVAAVK